jgi:hypothetical protein
MANTKQDISHIKLVAYGMEGATTVTRANSQPANINTPYMVGQVNLRTKQPNDRDFQDKKRIFELQSRVYLKNIPPNHQLRVIAEVTETVDLSSNSQLLTDMLSGMARVFNLDLYHSFSNVSGKPQFSLPFHQSMQHMSSRTEGLSGPMVLLPDGKLGINETISHSSSISPDNQYTIGIWNAYIDLESWRLVNMPGVSDMDLSTFWGNSSLHLVLVAVPFGASLESALSPRNRLELLHLEIVHDSQKRWFQFNLREVVENKEDSPAVIRCPRCERDMVVSECKTGEYKSGWRCGYFQRCQQFGNARTGRLARWLCEPCEINLCFTCRPNPNSKPQPKRT